MMRLKLTLLLFLCYLGVKGQIQYEYFNSEYFWGKLVMETAATPLPTFTAGDSVIVVVSTRVLQPDSFRFVGEIRDVHPSHNYLVFSKAGKWHVHPFASMADAIRAMPHYNRDWVIYTEGMGKIFTTNLDRGMQLSHDYGVNTIVFDYPSIRTGFKPLRNYVFAYRNARSAYKDYIPLLDTVMLLRTRSEMGNGKLSLFFHSMGNNVMRAIAKEDLIDHYNTSKWIDNIILNAPCVPRRKNAVWLDRIQCSKQIYVHYNPMDITLKLARLAGFRQIMGEHIKKPLCDQVTYINFEVVCGTEHSNFLHLYQRQGPPKESFNHYKVLLHGEKADVTNSMLYRRSHYRHIGWELLKKG